MPLSVIVSSAAMGEGKSTISSFLAVSAAVHKKLRVLLIDADLRRPNIHTLFNLDIAPGVTDLDNSGQDWNEATRELQGIKGLSILTAGVSDNRPTDHIERGVIQNVVASASKWFDLVIADSPPLLPVQDALQLAPSFDGVLLVAKAGDTNRDLTKSAVETLHRHNLPILGVTLNNALGVLPHYYGHYSYRPSQ